MGRNLLLFIIALVGVPMSPAQNMLAEYYRIQEGYQHLPKNDSSALPAIRKSVIGAKNNHNFKHLVYAYEDAVFYIPNRDEKLKYSDSLIAAAKKTGDNALISKAFLDKGTIYYFNYRQYRKALNNYLTAVEWGEKTDNLYLIYKIKYNIGLVKSYLGYHEEALQYFLQSARFFKKNLDTDLHPTLRFNYTRGYLNALHQGSIAARHLKNYRKTDSLLSCSEPYRDIPAFSQENAYFLKEKGIAAFRLNLLRPAIDSLLLSAKILREKNEPAFLSVAYYYLGSAYINLKNKKKGISYLKKTDSLYRINKMILPETRSTYELLLKNTDYNSQKNEAMEYIQKILQMDSILQEDHPYLSARLYREITTKKLLIEKEFLLKSHNRIQIFAYFVGPTVLFLMMASIWLWFRKKKITYNYQQLQLQLQASVYTEKEGSGTIRKRQYESDMVEKLLLKLDLFEERAGFIKSDLTLLSLANILHTNKNYLSYVLNEHKKMNFNTYMATLRIQYITHLMNTDTNYLKLHLGALSESCGVKTRQQFSRLFYKINKIHPSEFIEQKRKELHL